MHGDEIEDIFKINKPSNDKDIAGKYEQESESVFNDIQNRIPDYGDKKQSLIKELTQEDVLKNRLQVGARLPEFELQNVKGENITSEALLNKKWLVISFYRGQWCPFCNIELRMLQKHLDSIVGAPATLVAISPQKPDISKELIQKYNLKFEVLYDKDLLLMKKFGIVYHLPEYLVNTYIGFGVDESYFDDNGKIQIPVPATYIVDNTGVIRFGFADVDYVKRLDPSDLVKFIQKNSI